MKCKKCGQDNNEEAKFCNNCGANLENNFSLIGKIKNINFKSKSTIIISIASLLVLILLSVSISIFTNPVTKFMTALKGNNIEKATRIYYNDKNNEKDKTKMINFVKDYALDIEKNFKEGKLSYDDVINKLDDLKEINISQYEVKEARTNIDKLNKSKVSFSKAEEYLKKNDYINALKEYGLVIEEDKNYKSAQDSISENKEKYKSEVLKQADKFAEQSQYNESIQLLNTASTILTNDNDIVSKLDISKTKWQEILKEKEEKEKEEAQVNQLLVVDSANLLVQSTEWKAAYPDMLQAIVTNKSDKTAKSMNIGFLAYDSNGYPLKILTQFDITDGNFERIANADNINLIPGAQYGSDSGLKLDSNSKVSTVKACVKDATFYDGTIWNNSYYQYWLEEYKEKQIQ